MNLKREVLNGLTQMQISVAWVPDDAGPAVRVLPFGEVAKTWGGDGDPVVQWESRVREKLPIQGAFKQGEVTIHGWNWVQEHWDYTRHHVTVMNDSAQNPCGDVKGGKWIVMVFAPRGTVLPIWSGAYMIEPAWVDVPHTAPAIDDHGLPIKDADGSLVMEDITVSVAHFTLPRRNLADGTGLRGVEFVIGWDAPGAKGEHGATRAHRAADSPDHTAQCGAIGTFVKCDESAGRAAANAMVTRHRNWAYGRETDPHANWGHRRESGRGGADFNLFGQKVMPGVQDVGDNLSADYYIGQAIAVERSRQFWLDWEEVDYFADSKGGVTYHEHKGMHSWAKPGFGRGTMTSAQRGDLHGWEGPNYEHRFNAQLFQLAGLTLHPVIRDMALQYAARAASAWSIKGLGEGGYYPGKGSKTDFRREWTRQAGCVSMGYHIADRWGMGGLKRTYREFVQRKHDRAVNEPGGWRDNKDSFGNPIPYAETTLAWTRREARLTQQDMEGTPLEQDGRYFNEPRRAATFATWQLLQIGPTVLLGVLEQDANILTMYRDMIWQTLESIHGDFNDPSTLRIPKEASPLYLGLGNHWQDGQIPPMMHKQVIEHWNFEAYAIAILFADHGVDQVKASGARAALNLVDSDFHVNDSMGTDVDAWAQLLNSHTIPQLKPLPPCKVQSEWTQPVQTS